MKFNSIKELEAKVKAITNVRDLQQDITVTSVGETFTVRFLGLGSAAGKKEATWIGEDNANTIRVVYTGDTAITVSEVVVRRP